MQYYESYSNENGTGMIFIHEGTHMVYLFKFTPGQTNVSVHQLSMKQLVPKLRQEMIKWKPIPFKLSINAADDKMIWSAALQDKFGFSRFC